MASTDGPTQVLGKVVSRTNDTAVLRISVSATDVYVPSANLKTEALLYFNPLFDKTLWVKVSGRQRACMLPHKSAKPHAGMPLLTRASPSPTFREVVGDSCRPGARRRMRVLQEDRALGPASTGDRLVDCSEWLGDAALALAPNTATLIELA